MAGAQSAWELLEVDKSKRRISTMSSQLDRLLGGGLAAQELTEIC